MDFFLQHNMFGGSVNLIAIPITSKHKKMILFFFYIFHFFECCWRHLCVGFVFFIVDFSLSAHSKQQKYVFSFVGLFSRVNDDQLKETKKELHLESSEFKRIDIKESHPDEPTNRQKEKPRKM